MRKVYLNLTNKYLNNLFRIIINKLVFVSIYQLCLFFIYNQSK